MCEGQWCQQCRICGKIVVDQHPSLSLQNINLHFRHTHGRDGACYPEPKSICLSLTYMKCILEWSDGSSPLLTSARDSSMYRCGRYVGDPNCWMQPGWVWQKSFTCLTHRHTGTSLMICYTALLWQSSIYAQCL